MAAKDEHAQIITSVDACVIRRHDGADLHHFHSEDLYHQAQERYCIDC